MDIQYIQLRHREIDQSGMKAVDNLEQAHSYVTVTACIDELLAIMGKLKGAAISLGLLQIA